jgi:hypothetical protein
MSHVTQDLVTSIDERLAHARAEIASLETALAVFDTPAVPDRERQPTRGQRTAVAAISTTGHRPRSASSTPAQSQPGPSRVRTAQLASGGDVDAERLQALLGEHDGLTTTAFAQHTAANRVRILAVLRRLETDGQIRRTGVRRSTRWHVITDEDRIAQRAAQLASQSRAAGATTTRPARRSARRS